MEWSRVVSVAEAKDFSQLKEIVSSLDAPDLLQEDHPLVLLARKGDSETLKVILDVFEGKDEQFLIEREES